MQHLQEARKAQQYLEQCWKQMDNVSILYRSVCVCKKETNLQIVLQLVPGLPLFHSCACMCACMRACICTCVGVLLKERVRGGFSNRKEICKRSAADILCIPNANHRTHFLLQSLHILFSFMTHTHTHTQHSVHRSLYML